MEKTIETKVIAKYNGHSTKANKSVDMSIKCGYDQLANSILLTQLLNVDISIIAKVQDEKPMKLGTFRLKELKIEDDGESVAKFNSMSDFVEPDNINKLVGSELIAIKFSATIELEEDDEGEEDDEWEE